MSAPGNSYSSATNTISNLSSLTSNRGKVSLEMLRQQNTQVVGIELCQITEIGLNQYLTNKELDNRYLEELNMKAAVERELNKRKEIEEQAASKDWKYLRVARRIRLVNNSSVIIIPIRPTNPQCRDPLFMQHEYKEDILKKPSRVKI